LLIGRLNIGVDVGLIKEIQQLENNMFNTLEAAHKAIVNKDLHNAKTYIATVELLNEEYKDLTKIDFVRESVIIDLYERLWSKSNA
jgi:hypothetical protein